MNRHTTKCDQCGKEGDATADSITAKGITAKGYFSLEVPTHFSGKDFYHRGYYDFCSVNCLREFISTYEMKTALKKVA